MSESVIKTGIVDQPPIYPTVGDNECSNSWLHYLQMLNGLCAAGARVSASIRRISSKSGVDIHNNDYPSQTEWDTITQSLLTATISAHSQSIPAIHIFDYCRNDSQNAEQSLRANKNIIDNILSIVNIQYRFCMASCERLVNVADDTFSEQSELNDHSDARNSALNFNPSRDYSLLKTANHLYSMDRAGLASKSSLDKIIDEPVDYLYNFQNPNSDFHSLNRETTTAEQGIYDHRAPLHESVRYQDRNASANTELYQGPTIKFLDTVRNLKYHDDVQSNAGYLSVEKSPKSSILKNANFGLYLSPQSSIAQASQLRRWSETAAHEMYERQDDSSNIRRWSVPWDGGQPPIAETSVTWSDSQKCNNHRKWTDERDPLETAIFLLSFRPCSGMIEKPNDIIPEERSQHSTCTSTANNQRGYSIWSGSGAIPFLKLPESQE